MQVEKTDGTRQGGRGQPGRAVVMEGKRGGSKRVGLVVSTISVKLNG